MGASEIVAQMGWIVGRGGRKAKTLNGEGGHSMLVFRLGGGKRNAGLIWKIWMKNNFTEQTKKKRRGKQKGMGG